MNPQQGSDFWFPEQASTFAGEVDFAYTFVLVISYTFFALIIAMMVYFMIFYRRRKDFDPGEVSDHNVPLELTWTIIPLILVTAMFIFGFRGYMDLRTPPANAYEIYATGRQWAWSFTYPNGHVEDKLHVPAGRQVKLIMTSDDVIHSLFIPAFRAKMDVVPGRYTDLWFEARWAGVYPIFCTEYCGTKHSDMLSEVVVHQSEEFDLWLRKAAEAAQNASPVEAGERLYRTRGCAQCHSLDGKPGIGPSFLGLYGSQRALQGGRQVTADENYIRKSILQPQDEIAEGFAPVMPTFQGRLDDKQIAALIEYLKTLR